MIQHRILVIDDEEFFLKSIKLYLESHGFIVDIALGGKEGIAKAKARPDYYSMIVTDYHMPDVPGDKVIDELRIINQDFNIIVFSGSETQEAAVLTWEAGASAFIRKSSNYDTFINKVNEFSEKYENERSCNFDEGDYIKELNIVSRSSVIREIAKKVELYRNRQESVLIIGETGTGKEVIARAFMSTKDGKKSMAINCGQYYQSENVIDSELFGYEKGAFTGANELKRGIFEVSNGGVVFLDELHKLGVASQNKLLRVLGEGTIRRVGGVQDISVQVRTVAAAQPILLKMIQDGRFLDDLYFRLQKVKIEIPPLRERIEDIEPLVAYFTEQFNRQNNQKREFSIQAIRKFEAWPWKGNVRELGDIINRVLIETSAKKIFPRHLPKEIQSESEQLESTTYEDFKLQQEADERLFLYRTISLANGNIRQTARHLGISESTLRTKMERLGLKN